MRWASSSAVGADLGPALDKALAAAKEGLGGERADLAFVFVSPVHARQAEEVSSRVEAALGPAALAGCTAGGVIGGGREHESQPAVSVLAGRCPGVEASVIAVEDADLPGADAPPSAWHAFAKAAPRPPP